MHMNGVGFDKTCHELDLGEATVEQLPHPLVDNGEIFRGCLKKVFNDVGQSGLLFKYEIGIQDCSIVLRYRGGVLGKHVEDELSVPSTRKKGKWWTGPALHEWRKPLIGTFPYTYGKSLTYSPCSLLEG